MRVVLASLRLLSSSVSLFRSSLVSAMCVIVFCCCIRVRFVMLPRFFLFMTSRIHVSDFGIKDYKIMVIRSSILWQLGAPDFGE